MKKITAIILSLLLTAAFALTSCKPKEAPKPAEQAAPAAPAAPAPAAPEAPAPEKK